MLEHVEAAAGSSHKGRLHARLCSERSKAGRRFSSLPAPRFPGDEAIAYHITGALLLRLLMHGILWHGRPGEQSAANQFDAIAAVSAFCSSPFLETGKALVA